MDKHNHQGIYAAIAASTIVSLLGTYFMVQLPKIEEVGGRANYKIYQSMISSPKYAENVKNSLESNQKVMNGEQPTQGNDQQPTEPKATGALTQDDIAGILKGSYVK